MGKNKFLVIGLDLAVVVIILLSGWIADLMLALLPDCYVAAAGFQCPACGGTRCLRYLASGRIAASFLMNPYFFVSFLLLGALLVLLNSAVLFGKGRWLLDKLARPGLVIVWAVGFVLFGLLRNLF